MSLKQRQHINIYIDNSQPLQKNSKTSHSASPTLTHCEFCPTHTHVYNRQQLLLHYRKQHTQLFQHHDVTQRPTPATHLRAWVCPSCFLPYSTNNQSHKCAPPQQSCTLTSSPPSASSASTPSSSKAHKTASLQHVHTSQPAATTSQHQLPTPSQLANHPHLYRKVPKSSLQHWKHICSIYFNHFQQAINSNDVQQIVNSVINILCLPSAILCRHSNGRGKRRINNEHLREAIINAINDASIINFIQNNTTSTATSNTAHQHIITAKALIKQGHIGRACKALMRVPVADNNSSSVTEQLHKLHPLCTTPIPSLPATTHHVIVEANSQFATFIQRLVNGTSPGPSGWTYDLLAQACDGMPHTLEAVATLIQHICNGTLPTQLRNYLLPSNLIPLSKPNGGIRPIAVGEIFWRAATNYLLSHNRGTIRQVLSPHQYGCAVPGGTEHVIHTLQVILEDNHYKCAAVSLDFTNAFNTLDRAFMLQQLYNEPRLQSLWNIAAWGYSSPSTLYIINSNQTLQSTNGVRQGDPLGCLLFANAISHALHQAVAPTNALVKCYAVLDDIRFAGPPELLADCVTRLQHTLQSSQLKLNPSKSELFWFHQDQVLPSSLIDLQFRMVDKAAIVLGAPVGIDEESIHQHIVKETNNYHGQFFKTLLSPLFHHQEVFLLLRYCILPKITHLMRTVRPQWLHATSQQFDQLVLNTIMKRLAISDFPPPTSSSMNLPYQTLITLPIRLGGLGFRATTTTSPLAYWSSVAACMTTIHQRPQSSYVQSTVTTSAVNAFTSQLMSTLESCYHRHPKVEEIHTSESKRSLMDTNNDGDNNIIRQLHHDINDVPYHLQHVLTTAHDNIQHKKLLTSASPTVKAILNSTSQSSSASAFLTTFPTEQQYEINDVAFTQAVRLRLGFPPYPSLDDIHQCTCGKEIIDRWHFLSCTHLKRTAITNRHNVVVNLIASLVRQCGGIALVEPSSISRQVSKHPDLDIMIGTRRIYVDVTVRHPLAPSMLHTAAEHPHSTLQKAEVAKHSKYDALAQQNHASFIPFVIDTFGHISDKSLQLLRDIITSLSPPNSKQALVQYHSIIASIAIAIVHSNSFIISTGTQQCRIGRRLYFSCPSSTSLSSTRPQLTLNSPPPPPLTTPACA